MSSDATPSRILTIGSPHGSLRIHVGGTKEQFESALRGFDEAAVAAIDYEDFVERAMRVISESGLMLADVLTIPSILRPGERLAEEILALASTRDVFVAWEKIAALLKQATDRDVEGVAQEPTLGKTRDYLRSVLYDLDEHAATAVLELRERFDESTLYLLLGQAPSDF